MQRPDDVRRLKKLVWRIPGALPLWHKILELRRRDMSTEEVFADIHRRTRWGGELSVSGRGSDPDQTARIERELPGLLRELGVSTMLDIPCGDFRWMRRVDLGGIQYTGADILPELIEANDRECGSERVRFERLDLLRDDLPPADLVLCRDCLVHFSFEDAFAALANIRRSGSRWLLTTTFTDRERNRDVHTGDWRPLNLQAPPFALPEPERVLVEGCTQGGGRYADKSFGLWPVSAVAVAVERGLAAAERGRRVRDLGSRTT